MQRYLNSGHRFAIALGLVFIAGVVVWVSRG